MYVDAGQCHANLYKILQGGLKPIKSYCESDPTSQLAVILSTNHGFEAVKFADYFIASRETEGAKSLFFSPAWVRTPATADGIQRLHLNL